MPGTISVTVYPFCLTALLYLRFSCHNEPTEAHCDMNRGVPTEDCQQRSANRGVPTEECQQRSARFDEIQPVFTADRLSTFARLDFLARVCRQLWNGSEDSLKIRKREREEKMRNLPLQDNKPNHFASTLTSLHVHEGTQIVCTVSTYQAL